MSGGILNIRQKHRKRSSTFQVRPGHGMQRGSSSFLNGRSWVAQVFVDEQEQRSLVGAAQRSPSQCNALYQPASCYERLHTAILSYHAMVWRQV